MMTFLWPFVFSFIRQALMAAGMYIVTKGIWDQATLTSIVGAVMALLSSAFSFINAGSVAAKDAAAKDLAAVVHSNVKGFGN